MKNYPNELKDHLSTRTFDLSDGNYHLKQRRAYYHINDYPILMHTHNFYELNIVVAGEGRHYIENKNYPAKKGDVFAFPPNIKHGYWTNMESEMNIFHLLIDKQILTQYHKELNSFPGFHILFEIEPQIRQQSDSTHLFLKLNPEIFPEFQQKMDELITIERSNFVGEDTIMALRAVCLLCDLSKLISAERQLNSIDPKPSEALFIIRTTEYMNANYDKKITVDRLAQVAFMSRSVFLRNFQKMMGISPMQHLKRIRVRYATEMLENSSEPITTIATNCGFFDCSHFIRIFKELTDTTPIEYRKKFQPKK